ncbi:hypothetical protein J6590_031470 [Homalodisca vitripennis]|nr:hypothetical protein J6590_031470 [Homalodisca vitripennis]
MSMRPGESREELIGSRDSVNQSQTSLHATADYNLSPLEKRFLLLVERGDVASVKRLLDEHKGHPETLNVNCVDPLNRSALIAAIENENIDLIRLLLEYEIKVKDSLLHAIKEEYVEAVEILLEWEERIHVSGQPYSWEAVDRSVSNFTPDITPLILAAHMNNYEILKILLDRGASLPMPHDVRCGCDECVVSSEQDSLRHSQSRINAYRALTSPSLIALSSRDPLLTAFELSWELRRLSKMETEFRAEYNGKILGSRHRHANDTNLHEKVSLAVFFNRRLGRGLLTCMKKSYENRLRKSVTFTASSRDLKVKPMSYNSSLKNIPFSVTWILFYPYPCNEGSLHAIFIPFQKNTGVTVWIDKSSLLRKMTFRVGGAPFVPSSRYPYRISTGDGPYSSCISHHSGSKRFRVSNINGVCRCCPLLILVWSPPPPYLCHIGYRYSVHEMRAQTQDFATSLLDHARTSNELEIMLNYDPDSNEPWEPGERQTLDRLKLAIKYKQKKFVAHPNVQQLLAAIWYEGLPGFRRKTMVGQMVQVGQLGAMFPVYSSIYMMAPKSKMGLFMKKPFVKFICHSASYACFLSLLGGASQRIEFLAIEYLGTDWMKEILAEWKRKERGALPGLVESSVILFVISIIWNEARSLWSDGLLEYVSDLWNIVDFIQNFFYVMWIVLRFTAWFIVQREHSMGINPWYPREHWDQFDPMLLSEGAFAAGMIFSFLKLVHIFSVNPHLGPLQISLGRMIIDIIKFFFIYTLVLFAFGCGLNQLLWYYSDLEKAKCYHQHESYPDFDHQERACTIWRRFTNLFETSQSLFWASFGLVDLMTFDLTGIKGFTRFWALLMFGSYSVINIIVLLNMLIAMMSNSYQIISVG